MKKLIAASVLFGLGVLTFACAGGTGSVGGAQQEVNPSPEGTIEVPPALDVTAKFLSANLADDCGASAGLRGPSQGDCAPSEDGKRCGGSACQQSTMQIQFSASGNGNATIAVTNVTLLDSTGKELATLSARAPKYWDADTYVAWDGSLPSGTQRKASWDLSYNSGSAKGARLAGSSDKMKLRITFAVNGKSLTIESTEISPEPDVVT